jgi:hypothetical protein
MSSYQAILKQYGPLILLLLAAALLAPSYWTALHTPATGIYHDDSIYLITGRTLAEGRGYSIESIPEAIAQTKYPVLFPALLAVVWKLAPDFPSNVLYLKLVPLLAALVWFALSYRLLKEQSGNSVLAATAVSLAAASPHVVFLSTAVLSETLFAALATASIFFFTRQSVGAVVGSAIFAAAAYHTRTIGFCLILAGILTLLWQKKWQRAALFAIVAGALALPWIAWQMMHRSAPDPYLSQENYYSAYNIVFNYPWHEKLQIFSLNLFSLPVSTQLLFDLKWGGILGFVALPFFVRAFFGNTLPLVVRGFLLLSGLVIVLWVWPPLRFLIPILPLLIWAVWSGVPTQARIWFLVSCWLLFAHCAGASHAYSLKALESRLWYPGKTATHDWSEFMRQIDWIRANTSPETIIQSNVDPSIYLFTNRKAIRGFHQNASLALYLDKKQVLGSPEQFEATLLRNKVSLIVETRWGWFLESKFLSELVQALSDKQPTHWIPKQTSEHEGFRILELKTVAKER